jgi:hypothetical protein
LGDEFDGPAGSPPNPALWTIVPRREMIKKPVFWDRPENMGEYSTDQDHVFLDGNSNLVLRATRNPGGSSQSNTYTGGKVIGNFSAPINHTFEARVKFECLTPGAWPAWWLLNDDNKKRGGEVDIMEWYGNMEWPSGTTVHARLDGTSFATMPFPVDDQWHRWRVTWNQGGMYFYADYQPGMEPYFVVPAFSISRSAGRAARMPRRASTPASCSWTGSTFSPTDLEAGETPAARPLRPPQRAFRFGRLNYAQHAPLEYHDGLLFRPWTFSS